MTLSIETIKINTEKEDFFYLLLGYNDFKSIYKNEIQDNCGEKKFYIRKHWNWQLYQLYHFENIKMKEREFTMLEFQKMPLEEEGKIKANGIEVKWILKDSDLVKDI